RVALQPHQEVGVRQVVAVGEHRLPGRAVRTRHPIAPAPARRLVLTSHAAGALHPHAHPQRDQVVQGGIPRPAQRGAEQSDDPALGRLGAGVAHREAALGPPALHGPGQSEQQGAHAAAPAGWGAPDTTARAPRTSSSTLPTWRDASALSAAPSSRTAQAPNRSAVPYMRARAPQYASSAWIERSTRSPSWSGRTGLTKALASDHRPACRTTASTNEGGFCAAMLFCLPVGTAVMAARRNASTLRPASSSSPPRLSSNWFRST